MRDTLLVQPGFWSKSAAGEVVGGALLSNQSKGHNRLSLGGARNGLWNDTVEGVAGARLSRNSVEASPGSK